jgi:NMD protein affecting ribosome stability and mRNA decay
MLYPKLRPSRPVQGRIDNEDEHDAYMNDAPDHEPLVCPECGNVYRKKQWYRNDQVDLEELGPADEYLCPGCQKIRDGYYYGELTMRGGFMQDHVEEISNMIDNEVDRVQEDNPLSKLVQVTHDDETVYVRTTNYKLAEHLGRSLYRAFEGELDMDRTEYINRVDWHRSE